MSETPETPQQRQLRIRQAKREAKLKADGQERLDKITKLSGRSPETMRNESLAPAQSISQASTPALHEAGQDPDVVLPTSAMFGQPSDAEQRRLQEEYMKAMFAANRQNQTGAGQADGIDENDPMIKMMQSMLGGMGGDPNSSSDMPFSADDISKMTGIPSFLTRTVLGGPKEAPPSAEQVQKERTWKVLRTVMAILIGVYSVFTVNRSLSTFGQNPPAPATVQNPFVVFVMAEVMIYGAKNVSPGRPATGVKAWFGKGKDLLRDGAIVVFVLGIYSWFSGST